MKKFEPKRILETKYLYCNNHGECAHVESGLKLKKWKCCECTVEYSSNHRKRRKIMAIHYKGGECELCGYKKSISVLTFHHVNPLFKEFDLSGTGLCKSWDKITKELDKCQLLCFNCHLEVHEKEDAQRKEANKKPKTNLDRKTIHQINCRKLGKKPSL